MKVNIENKVKKQRLSIITDTIILLIFLGIFLIVFKSMLLKYNVSKNLSLEDIEISNKNYILINDIKEKYGIKILYGLDTFNIVSKVKANIQTNEYKTNVALETLQKSLKKYPDVFFENTDLTIVLVDSFNNNNLALATRNNLNKFNIYMSDNKKIERSFHHEMYHVFEYKMGIIGSDTYSDWNELNPEGFVYASDLKNLDSQYVYDSLSEENDTYFVTKYSKTSEKEDRAEIFAEIMTFKTKPKYLVSNCSLYTKASYIRDVMTEYLKNDNSSYFYWNRF